jgi:hypothetical protein
MGEGAGEPLVIKEKHATPAIRNLVLMSMDFCISWSIQANNNFNSGAAR